MIDFDETTNELLSGVGRSLVSAIQTGLELRVEAKKHEQKAKDLVASANRLLAPAFLALDIKQVVSPSYGRLDFIEEGKSVSVSRAKMETYLLEYGVSPTILKEARDAATTEKRQEYQVRFTPPKAPKS